MGSTKEIWLSEGGGVNMASSDRGMVEANIRVHRWFLISRVRDVDAAEARFVFC